MSQELIVNIKTTSDVPQAVGRAGAAVTGFNKQLDDIGKKFGNSFKDIFLSFLGPMALVGTVMTLIGKIIADNQKKHDDANKAAIDNTNALMSAEDKYWANKRNNEKTAKGKEEEAKTSREDVTFNFLETDPRGREMRRKFERNPLNLDPRKGLLSSAYLMSGDPAVQAQVQAFIAADMAKNPLAGVSTKDSTFTGPSGFSNVIGVGSNPVLENMTRQTDIQQQILEYIKAQVPNAGRLDVPDFTKQVPLTLQKSGLT